MFKSPLCWTACPAEGVFVRNEPSGPAKQDRLEKNRQIENCVFYICLFLQVRALLAWLI